MSRILTDLVLAGLAAAVVWTVWYLGPVFLDAVFDPHADRFEDVDGLVERERSGR